MHTASYSRSACGYGEYTRSRKPVAVRFQLSTTKMRMCITTITRRRMSKLPAVFPGNSENGRVRPWSKVYPFSFVATFMKMCVSEEKCAQLLVSIITAILKLSSKLSCNIYAIYKNRRGQSAKLISSSMCISQGISYGVKVPGLECTGRSTLFQQCANTSLQQQLCY